MTKSVSLAWQTVRSRNTERKHTNEEERNVVKFATNKEKAEKKLEEHTYT